jgi:aryl-alcohol dehydrogenase-like predicted oxidoreductase
MQFKWTTDEPTSYRVLDVFAEAGGNFLDTADIYSSWAAGLQGGEAEIVIGNWMARKGNRRQVVVATKARGRMWPGPNGEGLSRAHLIQACDDSLRRLQTDYIDLYQTHWPDDDVAIEETMRALDDLVKAGKVRYVGCSNYKGWQLVEALLTSRQLDLVEYVSVQPHWSLVERVGFETDAYAVVRKYGLGIIPYSPLAAGFLTGKYRRNQPLPESKRASGVQRWLTDKNFDVLDRLSEIGRARGKTVSQIALAWLLSMPSMTAPIIGANTPDQLSESLGAVGVRLTPEEMQSFDALTAPPADED